MQVNSDDVSRSEQRDGVVMFLRSMTPSFVECFLPALASIDGSNTGGLVRKKERKMECVQSH